MELLSSEEFAGAASARTALLRPNSAIATAVPTKVDLAILIDSSPHCYWSKRANRAAPSAPLPLTCQYSTTVVKMPSRLSTNHSVRHVFVLKQPLAAM